MIALSGLSGGITSFLEILLVTGSAISAAISCWPTNSMSQENMA
jgi:hypothetical protein